MSLTRQAQIVDATLTKRYWQSEPASTPAPLEAVAPPAPKPERASEPTPRPEKAAEPALEPALAPERTPKPAPEPAPEPTPKSAPEPAPKPASEPAPEPAPGPAGEIEKPAEWTQADDDTLIKMKEEKKTWAEIEGAIEEKERDAIKARYKELMSKKSVETSQAEADSPESKIDIRKGKGKGKEERKSKEVQDTKDNPPNNGRPLIHFDQGDGLTIEDVSNGSLVLLESCTDTIIDQCLIHLIRAV